MDEHSAPRNIEFEKAIVRIARSLFDYTNSQDDYEELGRLDSVFDVVSEIANNYHNQTGGLHPDLALELGEWATFKSELLAPDHAERVKEGKSGLTPTFVDDYGKTPEKIIVELEKELGL